LAGGGGALSLVPKGKKKGFNSVVILRAWSLWKHRNKCVFDGGSGIQRGAAKIVSRRYQKPQKPCLIQVERRAELSFELY
jgi:hypothetical protein